MACILFVVGLLFTLGVFSIAEPINEEQKLAKIVVGSIKLGDFKVSNIDDLHVKAAAVDLDEKPSTANQPPESLSRRSLVTYSVGFRSYGDRLVARASNFRKFDDFTDVKINIQYPNTDPNIAAVVTGVDIQVDQGSNDGNAYIVEGGIGERNIKLTLEISNTTYYSFSASIYGV